MGRRKNVLLLSMVFVLLLTVCAFAVDGGGIQWRMYFSDLFKIKFYIPVNLNLSKVTSSEWTRLQGRTSSGIEVEAHFDNKNQYLIFIKEYAAETLGISHKAFRMINKSKKNALEYRVYLADMERNGKNYRVGVIVAKHIDYKISYMLYLLMPYDMWEDRREAFTFWYENITGL
ncbi:MAG: hypothetical protein GY853_03125 [PVC group bacterium]|nr:hypothetical protein [PVC group bacterium]